MAVKIIHDDDVRAAFEKILWVSVGQEPDIRALQASLLFQINEQTLSSEVPDDKVPCTHTDTPIQAPPHAHPWTA